MYVCHTVQVSTKVFCTYFIQGWASVHSQLRLSASPCVSTSREPLGIFMRTGNLHDQLHTWFSVLISNVNFYIFIRLKMAYPQTKTVQKIKHGFYLQCISSASSAVFEIIKYKGYISCDIHDARTVKFSSNIVPVSLLKLFIGAHKNYFRIGNLKVINKTNAPKSIHLACLFNHSSPYDNIVSSWVTT